MNPELFSEQGYVASDIVFNQRCFLLITNELMNILLIIRVIIFFLVK